ncbi:MAG: iron complex outermembrane receptor protein [Candidatus Azotimanducaceae bacterium]|jgi:iron complex outermembrane receptor protein
MIRSINRTIQLAAILTIAASAASVPTWAAEKKRVVLEEVLVTARKIEESAQTVPIAMTALTKELESSTIRDITDLNGFAPNVQIGEDGSRGGGGAVIAMRGISPSRTDDNSLDAPVGVMIDGIYLGSLAGQVLENFDLERVEILRGPQGTLFGKNTIGGVIHVIRSRPTGEFGARIKATAGEDGQQELRAVVNTSLIEDTLALKLFGSYIQDDGFSKNITIGGKNGATDYKSFGATFLYTPNEDFEALFTMEKFLDQSELSAFNTNFNLAAGVAAPPTGLRDSDFSGGFQICDATQLFSFPAVCRTSLASSNVSENDTRNAAELDTTALTLALRYDLNEHLTLVSTTGYRDLQEEAIFDFDGSAAPFITIEKFNDFEQLSEELRIDGNYDNFNFTAGLYYFTSEFDRDWRTGGSFWQNRLGGLFAFAPDPAPGLTFWNLCQTGAIGLFCDTGIPAYPGLGSDLVQVLYEQQETTSYAVFAQGDWQFAEDWTLTLGLRWTREEKDFIAGQAYLTTVERQDAFAYPAFADLDNSWTETSPKIGLTYQLNDNAIIFGTYSEGFHSGGFFGTNQNIADFERDQYEPEFAKTFELGYKSMMMEGRLRLNVVAFYNDFTDKQESSVSFDPVTNTVATIFNNVSDATYSGIELETEFQATERLRLFLNYGYLDAEYDSFATDLDLTDSDFSLSDASGLRPRDTPDYTLGFGASYIVEVGPGHLELYAKYTEVDDSEDLLNTDFGHRDSSEDLTASIAYHGESYTISAFGRNLTDDQVETGIPIADLFAAGSVNQGRIFGLEFTYEM